MIYYKNANLVPLQVDGAFRRNHKYFPLIAAFDIETTRFQNMAFMYIWQFGIGEDLVVYGRTWEEFQEWLRIVQGELRLAHDFQLVVYVHDLRYDFQFFKQFVHIDEGSIIARTQHKILQFSAGCFEFRDSYSYTEQPLREMGKAVGIEKLPDFDYSSIRLPCSQLSEREMQYCENDIRILTRFFAAECDAFNVPSRIPLTLTKRVERYLASEMSRSCTRHERFNMAGRQLDATKEEDYEILKYLRIAYFGGFNYATAQFRGDKLRGVFGADIDTSYISQIMLHRFPVTKFKKMDIDGGSWFQDHILELIDGSGSFKNRACLIHFKADYIKAKIPELAFLPIYPKNWLHRSPEARRRMKTEHVSECSDVETVLTDIDFRLFYKWYDITGLQILDIYSSRYMPLPEYVINASITLAAQKHASKEHLQLIKDSGEIPSNIDIAEYMLVKSMCARIYGVFVKDPIRMQYVYDNESCRVMPAGLTGIERAAEGLDVNGEGKKNFSPTLYQWGVWVASWARKSLLDPLYEIATYSPIPQPDPDHFFNRTVIYSDTDSIYWHDNPEGLRIIQEYNEKKAKQVQKFCAKYGIENPHDIAGIGQYKIEYYKFFKVLGLKQYAFIDNKSHFQYHISGLPQPEYSENGTCIKGMYFEQWSDVHEKLDAITEDLSIPAELTGTLKSRYIEEEQECCVSDEDGNCMHIRIPSCVILEPQAFKAAMPALQEIAALIDPDKFEAVMKRNFYEE